MAAVLLLCCIPCTAWTLTNNRNCRTDANICTVSSPIASKFISVANIDKSAYVSIFSKSISRKSKYSVQLRASPDHTDVRTSEITEAVSEIEDANNSGKNDTIDSLSLGLQQLQPFLDIAIPFFRSDPEARKSLLALSAITLLNSGVSVAFSYISRDFYNALNQREEGLFYEKVSMFFIALVVAVPVSVYYRYIRERLSIYWREALSRSMLQSYFSQRMYYSIETLREIDNPDQRIAEDIQAFTRTSLAFFITIFTSIIDLVSFAAILYNIYPTLFLVIIVYAGAGSLITTNLGRSLLSLNYQLLVKEANFRFQLFRVRENVESIAFYDDKALLEQKNTWDVFQQVISNQLDIAKVQRNLEYFTTSYRYLIQILPSLILAPLYFQHQIEFGTISQSFSAFNHVLSDFSIIINQFEALSGFTAGLSRLSTFLDRLQPQLSSEEMMQNATSTIEMQISSNPLISRNGQRMLLQCSNLTIRTPDNERVILGDVRVTDDEKEVGRGVDIAIPIDCKMLIVGPSGAGKSSFLRAIAGLWRNGGGEITWDSSLADAQSHSNSLSQSNSIKEAPKAVFFLPQKPYNIIGDLRSQIMYPSFLNEQSYNVTQLYSSSGLANPSDTNSIVTPSKVLSDSDEKFIQILRDVKLDGLAERVGNGNALKGLRIEKDWSKMLSMGEQQRLAFARVLYNKPKLVVLDGKFCR